MPSGRPLRKGEKEMFNTLVGSIFRNFRQVDYIQYVVDDMIGLFCPIMSEGIAGVGIFEPGAIQIHLKKPLPVSKLKSWAYAAVIQISPLILSNDPNIQYAGWINITDPSNLIATIQKITKSNGSLTMEIEPFPVGCITIARPLPSDRLDYQPPT
jgi:hypothetical protein